MSNGLEVFTRRIDTDTERGRVARRILELVVERLELREVEMLTAGMLVSMGSDMSREQALEGLFYLSNANVRAFKFVVAAEDAGGHLIELQPQDVRIYLNTGTIIGLINPDTGELFSEEFEVVYFFRPAEELRVSNAGGGVE